jgi:predicted dehydrogenase
MGENDVKLGILGCGLIGRKRALACGSHTVVWVYDVCSERAERLAGEVKTARMARSAEEVLEQRDVDAVVVATTHDQLAPLSLAALNAGKHVLVEKPAARSVAELQPVLHKAAQTHLVVKVGFNHRFHPAIWRVKEWVDRGELQPLMLIRGRYGHGGRLGYEREWRADERISGGGETIDQGIHLIDLARWLLGDFEQVVGYAPTLFWDMAVEDNCFMMLRTASGACAFLHASWTEWKNMFSLEVYGKTAKAHVEGLGGSYGTEQLTLYKMLPQMGPPEVHVTEYPGADESWYRELENFAQAIELGRPVCGGLEDALAALRIVEAVRRNRERIG